MLRRMILVLLFVLAVLFVAYAVFMGAAELARAMGDAAGGVVLLWVARGCLLVGVIDMVLLLAAVAAKAAAPEDKRDKP